MAMYSVPSSSHNLDVLSAMSFQDVVPGSLATSFPVEEHPMLLGGLMVYSDCDEGRAVVSHGKEKEKSNGQTKRKNVSAKGNARKKTGHEAEVTTDGSKKRGRPRVDCADKTAAERRRTQIRLAQRAYRMRKETAISSLSQRVSELETNMQEMRKAFLAFNDEVLRTGALSSHPRLAQQLRTTAKRVMSLAPEITERDRSPEDLSSPTESLPQPVTTESPHQPASNGSYGSSLSDDSCQNMGNEVFYFGREPLANLNNGDNFLYMNTVPANFSQFYAPTKNNAITSIDIPPVSNPCMERPAMSGCTVPSPRSSGSYLFNRDTRFTYSYQEASFARHLHRRSLEFGYSLLTNPGTRPEQLIRKFRLTFYLTMKSRLLDAFTTLLHKGAGEPLEFLDNPIFCVGRAGMHYPRRDDLGNEIFPPNMQSLDGVIGALPSPFGETQKFKNVEEFIEKLGFNGDWFDCHDVEGYLKAKGIHIENLSTFVEVPSSVVTNPSGPLATGTFITPPNTQHNSQNSTSTAGSSYSLPTLSNSYPCHNDGSMQFLGLDPHLLPPRLDVDQIINSNATTPSSQTLIMDVDKFTTRKFKYYLNLLSMPFL
ncbi:uncharacterized protein GIQ15_01688 [Arthroderma uncinatum]|uniref:uncharacterized protein n=1 Tax=Arthroderma uncinatum TaxID=74035 RepID=UPI00144A831E|nr:uncharacterized protein GIQ15_01688 [Arthroderma uncinatum]KAF3492171.1 hypothetical protein GIQ15_01688 [Arthroderma uncinatum]